MKSAFVCLLVFLFFFPFFFFWKKEKLKFSRSADQRKLPNDIRRSPLLPRLIARYRLRFNYDSASLAGTLACVRRQLRPGSLLRWHSHCTVISKLRSINERSCTTKYVSVSNFVEIKIEWKKSAFWSETCRVYLLLIIINYLCSFYNIILYYIV